MNKKLKRIMISSGAYIVLMSILLIGVSTAKYTQATVAYSSFGAAAYNVVLLGSDPDTGELSAGEGTPEQFGKTLLSGDYLPGMVYSSESSLNTAKVFPFSVANGTCEEDVAEVAQNYTITLRTTRNLPLDYKLIYGSTVFNASGPKALDKNGKVITNTRNAQMDANGIAWYEWTFKDIVNTEEGTLEQDMAPVFSLNGGVVRSNEHAIIVEWPIRTDENGVSTDNSIDYMNEIELLEVRVASAQQIILTEDVQTITVDPTDSRLYSRGVILLGGAANGNTVEYKVDFRAFRPESDGYIYEFEVENGAGKQAAPIKGETGYTVSLQVPLLYQMHSSGTGTVGYEYILEVLDEETGLWSALIPVAGTDGTGGREYKLDPDRPEEEKVDITQKKSDNAEEYNQELFDCSEPSSPYRIVKQLHYGDAPDSGERVFRMQNTLREGEQKLRVEGGRFRIRLLQTNGNIPSYAQLLGKIVIQVKAAR